MGQVIIHFSWLKLSVWLKAAVFGAVPVLCGGNLFWLAEVCVLPSLAI